jgi:N-acetylmuramoyl-L-alanine amidase
MTGRRQHALAALSALALAATVGCNSHLAEPAAAPSSVPSTSVATPTPTPTVRHHGLRHRPRPTPSSVASVQALPALPAHSLRGLVIGIDPGHNGGNYRDPSYINHQVWNGREMEACDTTGTETDGGYPEPLFTFKVASYLAADLRAAGARVVMTRTTNDGVGPCIDRRARIIDDARAAVAIDIHADGGPSSGRGFAILEPVDDGVNHAVLGPSYRFGSLLRSAMLAQTSMPVSTYDGSNGIAYRDDLAGLNLTTVPKVLVEVGNMRNATDAALITSTAFQRQLADTFLHAIARFVTGR